MLTAVVTELGARRDLALKLPDRNTLARREQIAVFHSQILCRKH
jgi:hypothetical protein